MWGGKCCFIFPEYSRYMYLSTNTNAIYRTCAQAKGMGREIFAIQGDDNVLNHWMYDFEDVATVAQSKLSKYPSHSDSSLKRTACTCY
jgi:hypothetical protein